MAPMGVEWSSLVSVSIAAVYLLAMGFLFVHADQLPKGFIYIGCGASGDTVNPAGLVYKSDKDMIATGMNKHISPELRSRWEPQLWTLRSFPNGIRNCYHLKPEASLSDEINEKTKYFIRASFVYGNYDGVNSTPIFDVYLGVNFWATVNLDHGFLEAIALPDPSTDYFDVCLVNTNNGVPYISTLDLRPLDLSLYQMDDFNQNAQVLTVWNRYDYGGSIRIRYQRDVYDRFWEMYECDYVENTTVLVSTNATITESNGEDSYKLPQLMLQTACRTYNSSFPLTFTWTAHELSYRFYFCFHFAEIEKLEADQFREMSIVFNDVHTITNKIKLQYLQSQTLCSQGYDVAAYQQNVLSISATSASTLPPILNGLEIFVALDTPNPFTFSQDVNAIRDIKQQYKVTRNWEGDPCEPAAFSWEGLNCSNGHPWARIISLNLSHSNLTADIAPSISALNALKYLDLSYNELGGVVPESLALLPQLQLLNLSGNKLTGVVPEALLQKYKNGTLVLSVEGNQELCWSPPCNHKKYKWSISIPILCSVIAAPVLVILLGVIIIIYTRKSKEKSIEWEDGGSLKLKDRRYSYLEVVSITDNFGVVIGEGGFGKVYLGALKDQTTVAVKVLSPSSQQGYKEFRAEAQLLMVLHHRNLVTLIGYCDEGNHKALLYEYMSNGNLQQYLSDTNTKGLNWMERLQVAVDAAQGLEYLHNGCKPPIIHRDLKPANILLDKTMQAKIADFGLSRTFATENQSQFLTRLAGTPGYLDPRTQTYGNVNKQSDVYSFGIILLELITGKPPIARSSQGTFHLINWVELMISTGDVQSIVDLKLGGEFNQNSAWKIIELAMSCTQPNALQRPDMSHVLVELKECWAVLHQNTSMQNRIISTRILSESEICPSPR